jgi:hypothetical protein
MADKNVEVTLKNVRLSFAHLFEPKEDENDDGGLSYSYQVTCLLPNDDPQVKVMQEAIKKATVAEWPEGKSIPKERKCIRDGEPKVVDDDGNETNERQALYEGYAGMYFVPTKRGVKTKDSPNPVQLLGPRKTDKDPNTGKPRFPRLKESDGLLYSGCYADVIIRVYAYNGQKAKGKKKHPDRINASLEAVKFVRHGDAFGAKRVDADSAFDEEDGDDGFDTGATGSSSASDDDDIG